MKLAIPAYFYPDPTKDDWKRVLKVRPDLVVVNPASGPGEEDINYTNLIKLLRKQGIRVFGYVATTWANKPKEDAQAEINTWSTRYKINGFFYDETATNSGNSEYYRQLGSSHLKPVILNPGTTPDEATLRVPRSIHAIYETDMESYLNHSPAKWIKNYDSMRFWHIIYGVPSTDEAKQVARTAKRRNAGYIWITSDVLPNPYDELPPYFEELKSFI